jgi:hypothetical protein
VVHASLRVPSVVVLAVVLLVASPSSAAQVAQQQAYVKASNTAADDYFGDPVAISGDTLVVGAYGEDSNATGVNGNQANNSASLSGAAYVFVRNGTTWTQQAYLKASNAQAFDAFGTTVAIDGDTIVVAATGEDSSAAGVNGNQASNGTTESGAAYVFVRSGTTWTQQAYLKASNPGMFDFFGRSLAVSGDTIVVGAGSEDSGATGVNGNQADESAPISGAAYVFVRNGTTWTQQAYLKASNTGPSDVFGDNGIAISGDTIVVGTGFEDSGATGVNGNEADESASAAGAAYVFVRSGTTWSQQAYLKASNTEPDENFGLDVDISGDTIVVGAEHEDSGATGVGGDQGDNSVPESGAAYVFVRSGTTWTQQAYLKAGNPGVEDTFGFTAAISGDTVIIGSRWEDSDATGVNGDGGNDNLPHSGAAYVFVRSGTTWTPHAYLKASNTGFGDEFGWVVSASGDTVVVAAPGERSNAAGIDGDQSNNTLLNAGAAYVFVVGPASAWTDEGSALAGLAGPPAFTGSGTLAAGSSNAVTLSGAAPSAPAGLFVALSGAPVPFKGGILEPFPLLTSLFLATTPLGGMHLPFTMVAGVPAGTELWLQWAIQDAGAIQGVALSNAIKGVTP